MTVKLGERIVGRDEPPFVIAEIGSNHDGSLETAKKYIKACAQAGVDAVKFQLFRAAELVAPEIPDEQNKWVPHPAWDLLKSLEVPHEWLAPLHVCCREHNVLFTCTPFDEDAVDALEKVEIPFYKVASGELTHRLFLEKVAETRKPIILSTGMGNLHEVQEAVGWLQKAESGPLVVLHCVSQYPPQDQDTNLRALQELSEIPYVESVGFSDHSPGVALAAASVALGARVIEKHVTFDRSLKGPDHPFAITVDELKELVESVHRVFRALGTGKKEWLPAEDEMRILARRGLWASRALPKGHVLQREDVRVVRPCLEGGAQDLGNLLGKKVHQNVEKSRPLPIEKDWQ